MPSAVLPKSKADGTPRLKELLRASKIAEQAGVHPKTVARWCDFGVDGVRLQCTYLGNERVVTLAWLHEFMDKISEVRKKGKG